MKLLLRREPKQPDAGCSLGIFAVSGIALCSIELPWIPSDVCRGGLDLRSCVPPGVYRLERHDTEKHPKTWALVNPELDVVHHDPTNSPKLRSEVLIHIANYPRELLGCIAIGTRAGPSSLGGYQVFDSGKAMRLLRAALPWTDDHTLEISEAI